MSRIRLSDIKKFNTTVLSLSVLYTVLSTVYRLSGYFAGTITHNKEKVFMFLLPITIWLEFAFSLLIFFVVGVPCFFTYHYLIIPYFRSESKNVK